MERLFDYDESVVLSIAAIAMDGVKFSHPCLAISVVARLREAQIVKRVFCHQVFVHATLQVFLGCSFAGEIVVFVCLEASQIRVMYIPTFLEVVQREGASFRRRPRRDVWACDHGIHHRSEITQISVLLL